jgi:4-hydroxy-tetrahydrodipicolinate reductase
VKVVIAGSAGRMGRTLLEAVLGEPDFTLAGALELPGSAALGKDAGELIGTPCGVRVSPEFASVIPQGDCLIDFTRPEGTLAHLQVCERAGICAVIGTTGFSAEHQAQIGQAARNIPLLLAPNMAVGVNAVFKLAEVAAAILGSAYDVEIIEAHHRHKVDAPSGTALKLGDVVARALGRPLAAVYGRQGLTGERAEGAIGFHAIRGGDIVGEHTVIFAGTGERVEVSVRSSSRMTYALGALRAARFLQGRAPGLYDMQDVLGLK